MDSLFVTGIFGTGACTLENLMVKGLKIVLSLNYYCIKVSVIMEKNQRVFDATKIIMQFQVVFCMAAYQSIPQNFCN